MRRRKFIALLGGATVAWPLAVRAQQGERMRRIGMVMAYTDSDSEAQVFVRTFVQALAELGWIDGKNVRIDLRWAGGEVERMRAFERSWLPLNRTSSSPTPRR